MDLFLWQCSSEECLLHSRVYYVQGYTTQSASKKTFEGLYCFRHFFSQLQVVLQTLECKDLKYEPHVRNFPWIHHYIFVFIKKTVSLDNAIREFSLA